MGGGEMRDTKPKSSMSKRTSARTVDEYLAMLPEDQRNTLEKLRKEIKKTAPLAEEVISYQIPGYKYHGSLVFFAAFKDHLSLYPLTQTLRDAFKEELKEFDTPGSTLRFTPEHAPTAELVKKMVKFRMKENEARGK